MNQENSDISQESNLIESFKQIPTSSYKVFLSA